MTEKLRTSRGVNEESHEVSPETSNKPEEVEESPIDMIDVAFVAMGGFGRFQKLSYLINTLVNTGAAFIMQPFVFLEKQPIYKCQDENGEWTIKDQEKLLSQYCNL